MATFQRDGVSLYYEERGNGYPLLLFAPGGMNSRASFWGGRPDQWIDPIVDLSDEFRVIAMDQRNAGSSQGPVRVGDGWHTYVADALALLDQLAIDGLAVMGGCIGVSYALRLCADAPGRLQAAVLQNPIGRGSDGHDHFGPMFDAWAKTLLETRSDVASDAIAALRAELFGGDFIFSVGRDVVQKCTVPMLVLPGNDAFHPTAIAQELARRAPHATLIDRWRPSEIGREASVALIREFLRRHTPHR